MKKLLLASALVLAFSAPSFAQSASEVQCDEATMTKMKADIDAMTDTAAQTAAMAEYELAMSDFKGNKITDCQTRIRQMDEKNRTTASGGKLDNTTGGNNNTTDGNNTNNDNTSGGDNNNAGGSTGGSNGSGSNGSGSGSNGN